LLQRFLGKVEPLEEELGLFSLNAVLDERIGLARKIGVEPLFAVGELDYEFLPLRNLELYFRVSYWLVALLLFLIVLEGKIELHCG